MRYEVPIGYKQLSVDERELDEGQKRIVTAQKTVVDGKLSDPTRLVGVRSQETTKISNGEETPRDWRASR